MKNSKPYVLFLVLSCPVTTAVHYFRNMVRLLGKDNVISCGPERSSISWDLKKGAEHEFGWDIELPKKDHPHMYSYTEIYDSIRAKGYSTDFDLILASDPNMFPFVGQDGFRPNCHISFYACDTHRGPRSFMKVITLGKMDSFIQPNEYYKEVFEYPHVIDGVHYNPEGKKFIISKSAFDDQIHKIYPDCEEFEKYDVIFVGNDGIDKWKGGAHENFQMSHKYADYHWKDDRGNTYKSETNVPLFNHGCPTDHRFFEYADRAELLCRLRKDFPNNFKILPGTLHAEDYAKTLNKGKIVINMSIAQDLNMRVGEALGCGRVLIADECEGMDSVCGINNITYVKYRKFYNPLNVNWDLTYDIIKSKIQYFLAHREKIAEMQNNAYHWIRHSGNSYLDRVKMIIKSTIGWEQN